MKGGIASFWVAVAVALILVNHLEDCRVSGCTLLWDQSKGVVPGYSSNTLYPDLRTTMQNTFGLTIQPIGYGTNLSTIDYEGVSMLWLEARHSGNVTTAYEVAEADAMYNFVRGGGSILLMLDGGNAGSWATWLFQRFQMAIAMSEVFFNETSNDGAVNVSKSDPLFTKGVSSIMTNGSTADLNLVFRRVSRPGLVVSSQAKSSQYDQVGGLLAVAFIDYWPRGRVVVVWDCDVFDTAYYNMADNAQLASNILEFLTQDCKKESCSSCPQQNGKCYAGYCACNPGMTGDDCSVGLSPCHYEKGCVDPPLPPTLLNPVQCPSGAITFGTDACGAEIECPLNQVTCIDGSCGLPSDCMAKTKNCPGVVCANGVCVNSSLDCPIVPHCPPESYRCADGTCQKDPNKCPNNIVCPNVGDTLCLDGVCRPECPLYDGCNATATNFMCSSFLCVANGTNASIACTTPCDENFNVPCWDGYCTTCNGQSPSFEKPLPLRIFIDHTRSHAIPIHQAPKMLNILLKVLISNGTFTNDVILAVNPVALGNLRDEIGEFASIAISAIVDLKIVPPTPFTQPIFLDFLVSPYRSDVQRQLNASLVFVDSAGGTWISLFSTVITTERPPNLLLGITSSGTPFSGPTTHFTAFSVLVGNYEGDSSGGDLSEGGDGDLDIILPAVLVPVIGGTILLVGFGVLGGLALYAWYAKSKQLSRMRALTSSLDNTINAN